MDGADARQPQVHCCPPLMLTCNLPRLIFLSLQKWQYGDLTHVTTFTQLMKSFAHLYGVFAFQSPIDGCLQSSILSSPQLAQVAIW